MKYFVADTTAEMGIRQLGEDRVRLLPDGSLEYRLPGSDIRQVASSEEWATDWDKMVVGAYNALKEEINGLQRKLSALQSSQNDLVAASPQLQRITKQLKLF